MPKIVAETIDMLCNISMTPGKGPVPLPRGCTKKIYDAAREVQKDPLTYIAATKLIERVKRNDIVLIATGANYYPMLSYGETDGPMGAVAIARALDLALGAKSIITIEESNDKPTEACIRASGAFFRELEEIDAVPGAVCIDHYPLGYEAGKVKAVELIEKYNPSAIIFVEKHAPNKKGVMHSILGSPVPAENMANAYLLAYEAEKRGILTIGFGDGGNETGNGLVYEAVRECATYGKKCNCECGDGIATDVKTDVFVAAAISNWGAYGVCAMLAYLKGNVHIMHDADAERRMLEACAHFGSVDGVSLRPEPKVDGVSMEGGQALVTLMRETVINGLKDISRDL